MKKVNKTYVCPIVFGIVMIIIGLCIKVPGGALTTYKILNGKKTDDYTFDTKYVAIDEYVGGDAYNYEIGASLVAGRTSGAMASRSIFIAGGLMCICFGCTLILLNNNSSKDTNNNGIAVFKKETTIPETLAVGEKQLEDETVSAENVSEQESDMSN